MREAAAKYMFNHPDDFIPFLPSAIGEDGDGAGNAGLMTPKQFEQYCATIRDTGVWGGEPEIMALSRSFNIPIHVIQYGQPPVVIHHPKGEGTDGDHRAQGVVRISYHRRMYGLGEVRALFYPLSSCSKLLALQFIAAKAISFHQDSRYHLMRAPHKIRMTGERGLVFCTTFV